MKTCDNCLYEYLCDWTPAAENVCCEDWRSECTEDNKNHGERNFNE